MKFKIVGRPEFEFTLSQELMAAILLCSEHHYDGQCQMASKPPQGQHMGGFLHGWRMRMYWAHEDATEDYELPVLSATFNQMDLLSKICENTCILTNEAKQLVMGFRLDLHKAMLQAQAQGACWHLTMETQ